MTEDIQFLKDLQKELQAQDHDCQAAPRFWTVGDFRMVECSDDNHEHYHVHLPNKEYDGDADDFMKRVKEEIESDEDFSEEAIEDSITLSATRVFSIG